MPAGSLQLTESRNPWPDRAGLPRGAAAALAALHIGEPRTDGLARLNEREWREALDFCDRSGLTLVLRDAAPAPQWVRDRTAKDAANNAQRLRRIEALYRDLAAWLTGVGIEFLALKGITQCPLAGLEPERRVQYDIDLFTPRESVAAARDTLMARGFEPLEGMDESPTDHLPAMIRKTGWQWRGDFFDPDIPVAVELHFQFWNERMERLPAPGLDGFWPRRVRRVVAGIELSVLDPADALGYASLHVLRHLLRGNTRPFHVYELACLLDRHAGDDAFWDRWRALHAPELRRLEAVGFRLAREWFGCQVAAAAREEIDRLPAGAQAWFEEFAASPAAGLFRPAKDELWLHLSLLTSRRDAWSVARRRLLPGRLPGPVDAVYISGRDMTLARRVLKQARYCAFLASRVWHHAAALPLTARSGARWWWKTNGFGRQFWVFLSAAVLYNFAFFVFVLLYNLHLLDLGFREDFLGVVSGATSIGCVAGTLPAAVAARRFGLRRLLMGAIAGGAAIAALRSLAVARAPLAGLALLFGVVFAAWAVVISPMIAGAVEEKRRPAAFSVFFATMFAVGVAGGWVGGRLPLWMHGKQPALLVSAGIAALALWPAWRLKPSPVAPQGARIYPRGGFLVRYLVPFALWNLATGSFNPFFNAYFARLHFPVERIGTIFSASQLTQAGTVLLAPLVFRKAGLVRGIVWMMAATALGLGALAAQPPGAAAVPAYIAYMTFQWMSEPGLSTLLMNRVDERERSGASSLNYLVAFSAQVLASVGAGALLAHWGYGPVLAGAAVAAGMAAVLFRALLR